MNWLNQIPAHPVCLTAMLLALALFIGCSTAPRPGTLAPRQGDEIVVAGQFFHTGTPVVLWMDPGGYDAYRVERRFAPFEESGWTNSTAKVPGLKTPNRYGLRRGNLTDAEIEKVRGGGWTLPQLQNTVDQFVVHFDVAGTSRQCFKILHDIRCLSVHFMLDLDGTIYQTLDLKERASHATIANTRSVGIEIANMGAYSRKSVGELDPWYRRDPDGRTRITIPERIKDTGIRTPNFVGRPARPELVTGRIQGGELLQYDYTPEQYQALVRLTAALCTVFPKMKCDYPKDSAGKLIPKRLPDADLEKFQGVLGHYHVQTNKIDPGPAFNWEFVIGGARKLMKDESTSHAESAANGHGRM